MTEKYKSEFIFELVKPIKYHDNGVETSAKELILKAPSNRQRRETAKLKQGFFRAIGELQKSRTGQDVVPENEGDASISGTEVLSIIMMSNVVDYGEYQEDFRNLLINDICWLSDKERMTSPVYDNMSDEDSERLIGEYISSFLLLSWMKRLLKG